MSFWSWFFRFWWLFGNGKAPETHQTQTRLRRWLRIMPKMDWCGRSKFDDFAKSDYWQHSCEAKGYDDSGLWYDFRDTCKPGSCFRCDAQREPGSILNFFRNSQKKSSFFDPDFSPSNPVNVNAAKDRGLQYDPTGKVYRDEDGCPVRDEFGQQL